MVVVRASDITPTEVKWLWYPYIPYGKVTLLQGDPGDGKSRFILTIAALLTRGEPMPFSEESREPISVLYQTTEDDMDDTVIPRFIAAGGDRGRLFFIDESEWPLSFDDPRLRDAVIQIEAKLLILDPLSSYIGKAVSLNMANEVRTQFNPLIQLAKETGCAIVVVAHLNKMSGVRAIYRSTGSIDVVGAARSSLLIARTGTEHPEERIMVIQKSNLAPTGKGILFSAGDRIEWIGEVETTADEVLGNLCPATGRPGRQHDLAREIIQLLLENGDVRQAEIAEKMEQAGIGWGTAKAVKAELKIQSYKRGKEWFWRMPEPEHSSGQ